MKITYKGTYEAGKEIYCNNAKTKLSICKNFVGLFEILFEETTLTTCAYSEDAKEKVEQLLKIGIGRNYKDEH